MGRNFLAHKNSGYTSRPLGHIMVELKKGGDTVLTGIVANKKKDFLSAVFTEKTGLGVLFKLFEGRLEKKETLIPEIENRLKTGKIAFITFNINDASYFYLKKYIDSFQFLGYDKLYNGMNDPRHGDGSGCTAFAVSFLELINLLDPEFRREWARDIAIPDKLIGGELTGLKVRLRKVFFSFNWAKEKTRHTHLKLYDPDLVYSWIEKKYDAELKSKSGKCGISRINLAKGIIFDCRKMSTPQFPMFLD
jgi:hypothetical protein